MSYRLEQLDRTIRPKNVRAMSLSDHYFSNYIITFFVRVFMYMLSTITFRKMSFFQVCQPPNTVCCNYIYFHLFIFIERQLNAIS